ncbi:MAG: hypothetical protein JSR33_07225 [Proteobacteria bacterium]|nr:hypothetical protein [Pseudomonadota bacterium]
MSRKEQYLSKIISNSEHIKTAKKFLGSLLSNIRVFVGYGVGGSGEYICGINIIQHIFHDLNYQRGIVEIIAPMWVLQKVMRLYNVAHLFNKDSLKVNLSDGLELHFYDLTYFNKHKVSFPEVELAIFPGIFHELRSAFGTLGIFTPYFEYQLTEVGKARRALYFNPFTENYDAGSIGFISQLKNQGSIKNFDGLALAYRIYLPDAARVQTEVTAVAAYNPALSQTLQLFINSQAAGDISFSIYGIHGLKNPTFILLNLILSAKKYAMKLASDKPLRIFLLSPISDWNWEQLKNKFNLTSGYQLIKDSIKDKIAQTFIELKTETLFIDITINNNSTLAQQATQVFRLPPLPWTVFAALFLNSTIAPVYEGANSANLLASGNAPRWGLPCVKHQFGKLFTVADEKLLPKQLKDTISIICPFDSRSSTQWERQRTPVDLIVPLMEQFSNQTRPQQLPENDRVSYAVALVSEKKHCAELRAMKDSNSQLNYCQWHEAILSPSYINEFLTNTATKGFMYGAFTGVCEEILASRWFNVTRKKAYQYARIMQLFIQIFYELWLYDDSSFGWLSFHRILPGFAVMGMEIFLAIKPALTSNRAYFYRKFINFLMFNLILLPRLINGDSQSILFVLPMSLLFLISSDVGRHSVKLISNNITFFTPEPRPEPLQPITISIESLRSKSA